MKLRFSIRDLLWFTALMAMGIGWWLEHRKLVARDEPVVVSYSVNPPYANGNGRTILLGFAQSILATEPGAHASLEPTSQTLIVLADPDRQRQVRELLDNLMNAKFSPANFPLSNRNSPLPEQPNLNLPKLAAVTIRDPNVEKAMQIDRIASPKNESP